VLSACRSVNENGAYLAAGCTSRFNFPSRALSSWGIESSDPGWVSMVVCRVVVYVWGIGGVTR
jgi:hypothetical protein